jgi:hypothetical protein
MSLFHALLGSGVVPRSPEQLVSAGLLSTTDYIYYDAERGVTVNGSNEVTSWANQSGIANKQMTGVASFLPDYVTDENGKRAVRFDESSMSWSYGSPAFASSATDYWICVVWRYRGDAPTSPAEEQRFLAATANPRLIVRAPAAPSPALPLKYQASWVTATGTPAGSTTASSGPVMDRLHIVEYDYKSADLEVLINHVKVADGGAFTQIPWSGAGNSGGENGNTNLDGDIYKLIIIKGGVSQAIKDELYNYFSSIYTTSLYKRSAFTPIGKSISFASETVIETGSGTLDYLAFPALAVGPTTNYMYLFYRRGSNHNNALDGYIAFRKSTDDGTTWSVETTITAAHATDLITDPRCIVTSTGRVIVMYTKIIGWVSGVAKPSQTWLKYSDDDGATWSSEIRMTTDYNSGQIGGPGNPIEISGTIYAPTYARPALTGNREGNLYKSTDNGLTWTSHAIMYTAISMDYEEPNIVNNGDGLCIALLRSDSQQWTRSIYSPIENMFSSRNSWNATLQVDAFQSIGKNGVCATPSGLLVSTGRDVATGRTVVAYSANRGQDWTKAFMDARTGTYEYGQFQYHPTYAKIIAVYAVETVAGATTQLICSRWNEV